MRLSGRIARHAAGFFEMAIRNFCKALAFLVIGVLIFGVVQEILTPEWSNIENIDSRIAGFYALEEDCIDALFLGTSHVHSGISPMKIYEDTGVCTYALGTSMQPIEISCILLEEALKTQTPKVVYLDVSMMTSSAIPNSVYYRMIMDNIPLNDSLIKMGEAYDKHPSGDGFWSVIFPIIKYHSRWSELQEADFELASDASLFFTKGQYISSCVNPGSSVEAVDNDINEKLEIEDGSIIYREGDAVYEESVYTPKYTTEMHADFLEYFPKIKALCDENDVELVLIKIPISNVNHYNGWNRVKSEMAHEFAEENDVTFIDLTYDVELINHETDYRDWGYHLNILGAEKVSAYLGEWMVENIDGLNTDGNADYDASLETYRVVRDIAYFQAETDFTSFLDMLYENMDHWTIYISTYDEYTNSMLPEEYELLSRLGLELIDDGNFHDGYAAVIDNGEVVYEGVSNRGASWSGNINGHDVYVAGSGFSYPSADSEISIDGEDYSLMKRGLNFVIWDNESDMPLLNVCFDTYSDTKTRYKNDDDVERFLDEYTQWVCGDD